MANDSEVLLAGIKLTCKHCGNTRFVYRDALLNTKGLTFFDLDWLNKSADVFVCARCGFLHWVLPPDPAIVERVNQV